MKKKKGKGFVWIGVVLVVAGGLLYYGWGLVSGYGWCMKANWGISLPASCKTVYQKDEGASFHGDGDRYHILSCSQGIEDRIQWNSQEGSYDSARKGAEEILDNLGIPQENRPPFDGELQWFTAKQPGMDALYLFFDGQGRLYICERFL